MSHASTPSRRLYSAQTPPGPVAPPPAANTKGVWIRRGVLVVVLLLVIAGLVGVFRSPEQQAGGTEEEQGFVLKNLRARIYTLGKLQGDVRARRGLLNVRKQETGLEGVTVTFFDEQGKVSGKVTSERGKMFLQDQPDKGIEKNDLELRDGVLLEGPGGTSIKMPRLRYRQSDGAIWSEGGWFEKRIATGKSSHMVVRGERFTTTKDFREIVDYGVRLHQSD